jgi:anti-sigma B factor antagonist
MKLTVACDKKCVRFTPEGDIDERGADILDKHFQELDKKEIGELVLDFKNVDYIGSSAIGQLILFYKKLAETRCKIRIENVSKDIYNLLLDLDIDKLISISRY